MRVVDYLAVLLVMLIWGLNFTVAKIALDQLSPLMLTALRSVMVAALLVPFFRVPRAMLGRVFLVSLTMGSFHFPLLFTGLSGVDAGVAAFAIQLQVPFSVILARILLKDRFTWLQAAGIVVAFTGVAIIGGEPRTLGSLVALLCIVAASFAWAVSNIQVKHLEGVSGLALSAWVSLFAAPQVLAASLLTETGQWDQLRNLDAAAWGALAYMALLVTVLSYAIWYWLVQRHPLTLVVPYTLTVPLFGVISAVIVLGEPLTGYLVGGGLLIILGLAITMRPGLDRALRKFWLRSLPRSSATLPMDRASK